MSQMRNYMEQTGELPDDCILGWLVMWSVIDCEPGITPEFAAEQFTELQLNPAFIPKAPKAIDAFRKATSDVHREHTTTNGNVATYLVRDVAVTADFVERHIIREVKDSRARVLTHEKAIEAVFYKQNIGKGNKSRKVRAGSEDVRLTKTPSGYPAEEQNIIDDLIDEIIQRYDTYISHLDAQRIRTIVRDYVKHLEAVTVKGGVYFVEKEHSEELHRLGEFMSQLPGRCGMHLVPLPDLASARDMIVEAFQTEMIEAMNRLVEKCAELQTTRQRITPEAYANIRDEYDTLEKRSVAFLGQLDASSTITASAAELAEEAVVALSQRMLDDNSEV